MTRGDSFWKAYISVKSDGDSYGDSCGYSCGYSWGYLLLFCLSNVMCFVIRDHSMHYKTSKCLLMATNSSKVAGLNQYVYVYASLHKKWSFLVSITLGKSEHLPISNTYKKTSFFRQCIHTIYRYVGTNILLLF